MSSYKYYSNGQSAIGTNLILRYHCETQKIDGVYLNESVYRWRSGLSISFTWPELSQSFIKEHYPNVSSFIFPRTRDDRKESQEENWQ